MKKRGKKGQITIFMILGIMLLLIGGTVFYFMTREEAPREAEIQRIAGEQPFVVQPVQTFVQDCIKTTATEAIKLTGAGGYIDAKDQELSIKTFNEDETQPTNADGITSLNGKFIPYWNYMKSSNLCIENCQFESNKPNLFKKDGEPSIEGQIDKYIQKELPNCINNFQTFENLKLESQGNIIVDTQIRTEDVSIIVTYPIEFKQEGKTYNLEKFATTIDFNYGKTYGLAEALANYEQSQYYLERSSMQWISGFAGIDFNKMPPIFGSDYGCEENIFWIEDEVHYNKLDPMLSAYVPSLQPLGIANQIDYEQMNQMQLGLYSQSLILTNETFSEGLTVSHTYLDWPTYLKIHTSNGGLLEPTVTSFGIPGFDFCLAQYKFAYDVSYPVLIEITDPEAFDGQGYTLQFAMETNIRRNEPVSSNVQQLAAQIPTFLEESMLCKANQRTSGNITIETFDAKTNQPLDGVVVNYCVPDADGTCSDDMCFIGTTKGGKIITQLPPGQGLIMLTKKPDYQRTVAIFASLEGQKGELKASLEPLRTIDISLQKKMLKKKCSTEYDTTIMKEIGGTLCPLCRIVRAVHGDYSNEVCWWEYDSADQRSLEQNESAIIIIKRMEPPSYTLLNEYVQLTDTEPTQEIKLIPGKYKIEAMLITDRQHVIPEEELCFDQDWYDSFGLGTEDCVTLDPVEMNGTMLGGVRINKETGGYFEITSQDLEKGELTIYAVSPELSQITKHDDIKVFGEIGNFTKELRSQLLPVFR